MPKQTIGTWIVSESACIWRASIRSAAATTPATIHPLLDRLRPDDGGGIGVNRRVVLVEEVRDELAAAADADLGEDRLDVVAHGVAGEEQALGDLRRRAALRDQLGNLAL